MSKGLSPIKKKGMHLKECRIHVALTLFGKEKPKIGRTSNKNNNNIQNVQKVKRTVIPRLKNDIKFDRFDNFPTRVSKGRCKKGETVHIYRKCDTRL